MKRLTFSFLTLLIGSVTVSLAVAKEQSAFRRVAQLLGVVAPLDAVDEPASELHVIGAGFGKTGTSSLKMALEILGYKSYHMDEVMANGHEDLVVQSYQDSDGKTDAVKKWANAMLEKGFNATLDFPTVSFYKELLEIFPNAKVILSLREENSWFRSVDGMMQKLLKMDGIPFNPFRKMRAFMDSSLAAKGTKFALGDSGCMSKVTEIERYQPWFLPWVSYPIRSHVHKEPCIKEFRRHNEAVRQTVPKEQLLEYWVTDGWEPLCKFLGKPVPNVPFPRSNDSAELDGVEKAVMVLCYVYPLVYIVPIALGVYIFRWVPKTTKPKKA